MNMGKFPWIILSLVGLTLIGLVLILGVLVLPVAFPNGLDANPQTGLTPEPPDTATPAPASVSGTLWNDLCASGREGEPPPPSVPAGCLLFADGPVYRANGLYETGEQGLAGVQVRLGVGTCPSIGLMTATTDDAGFFQFANLPAGTYCVSIDPGDSQHAATLLPGNWTSPLMSSGPAAISVTVAEGESRSGLGFGWDPLYLPQPQVVPSQTPPPATPTTPACLDRAVFVLDVTIPDNTNLQPGKAFEKVWRLRNNGTCTWNQTYNLVFLNGHSMAATGTVPLAGDVAPGNTVDLKVNMVAPAANGVYRGNWMLSNSNGGLFGIGENADKPFWVQIVVGPVSPGGPLSWRGEYFSNRNLSGTPTLVRYDSQIDFNWKKDAPAAVLPVDGFSVRWTASAEFDAATYRFKVALDDGARLYVDDKLVIDDWKDGTLREVSGDTALAKGTHTLRLEYYERRNDARIRLTWEKVPSPSFPDWKGEYWTNRDLSGSAALVRNDKKLDFDWGTKSPAVGIPQDNFSARWTRNVHFEGGTYRFNAHADDGIRVYVDGKRIIDEWHASDGSTAYSKKINLSTGKHKIVVEYYERTGRALVEVWWDKVTATPTPTATATQPAPTSETPVTTEPPPPPPTEEPPPTTPPEPEIIYNFAGHLCDAQWHSSASGLSCPGAEGDIQGFVQKVSDPTLENGSTPSGLTILMSPEAAHLGWIEGVFPTFSIQAGDEFRATIGCQASYPECDVGVELNVRVEGGSTQTLGAWRETYDGNVRNIVFDLTPFAGQSVAFVFNVYAENASSQNILLWAQPALWR